MNLNIGVEQMKVGLNKGKWCIFALFNFEPYILTMGGFKPRTQPIQPEGIMLWNQRDDAVKAINEIGTKFLGGLI